MQAYDPVSSVVVAVFLLSGATELCDFPAFCSISNGRHHFASPIEPVCPVRHGFSSDSFVWFCCERRQSVCQHWIAQTWMLPSNYYWADVCLTLEILNKNPIIRIVAFSYRYNFRVSYIPFACRTRSVRLLFLDYFIQTHSNFMHFLIVACGSVIWSLFSVDYVFLLSNFIISSVDTFWIIKK